MTLCNKDQSITIDWFLSIIGQIYTPGKIANRGKMSGNTKKEKCFWIGCKGHWKVETSSVGWRNQMYMRGRTYTYVPYFLLFSFLTNTFVPNSIHRRVTKKQIYMYLYVNLSLDICLKILIDACNTSLLTQMYTHTTGYCYAYVNIDKNK